MAAVAPEALNPKQEQCIVALLNEPTINKAAATAGVGERTIHRWLREPEFARAYRNARRQAFSHAVALALRYAPLAVQTLTKISADEKIAPATRVAAASALLKVGRDSIELDDLAGRIEALEAAAKEDGK